ncbi:MAG: molybdopterin-dependent oxidoreductase [Gammaproteobacteria bacterium]|nr:molybdopterin-dependent oxidoreductase [Pseudomonadales bacterium]MCP5347553.1 molybdopterin-dependent oxidoreductase [Pseudomonadales bacterium]
MKREDESRRELLKGAVKGGVLAAGAISFPGWLLPTLAQGEQLVPFTDIPDSFQLRDKQSGSTYFQDIRQINSFYSPNEDFYVVQHYGQPQLDLSSYRLKVTGMVDNPMELTLDQVKNRENIELDAGWECGGNRETIFNGLVGNGRWRGISLSSLLEQAGIQDGAKEIVFFGGDIGTEEIRGAEVDTAFARGLSIPDAMRPENMLAFEMNGEPLPLYHGRPLRLIVPGWYGVANVKWLTQIHVQDTRFMGRFMGRDYVTLKKEVVGGVERWVENSVTTINMKSVIARVSHVGNDYRIQGFVLNDGTPISSVEVKVDDGPWQRAELNPRNRQYTWKLFSFNWNNPAPGEHTIVSRVTDVNGNVQPTADQVPEKVSYWENYAQWPRTVRI